MTASALGTQMAQCGAGRCRVACASFVECRDRVEMDFPGPFITSSCAEMRARPLPSTMWIMQRALDLLERTRFAIRARLPCVVLSPESRPSPRDVAARQPVARDALAWNVQRGLIQPDGTNDPVTSFRGDSARSSWRTTRTSSSSRAISRSILCGRGSVAAPEAGFGRVMRRPRVCGQSPWFLDSARDHPSCSGSAECVRRLGRAEASTRPSWTSAAFGDPHRGRRSRALLATARTTSIVCAHSHGYSQVAIADASRREPVADQSTACCI